MTRVPAGQGAPRRSPGWRRPEPAARRSRTGRRRRPASSSDTQATGVPSRLGDPSCQADASRVVLPKPAGADTRTSAASRPRSSASLRRGRATSSRREVAEARSLVCTRGSATGAPSWRRVVLSKRRQRTAAPVAAVSPRHMLDCERHRVRRRGQRTDARQPRPSASAPVRSTHARPRRRPRSAASTSPPGRPTPPRDWRRQTGSAGRFITLYALSYTGGALLFLGPLLVSLALKVNDLVGIDDAPRNLALVTGIGSLLAIVSQPALRPAQRPHHLAGGDAAARGWSSGWPAAAPGILTVALAPNIAVVLVGWCIAQVFFNALLAAQAAVLPDQVPSEQRGLVSGVLGVCLPVASVAGTFLVQAFDATRADHVPRAVRGRRRLRAAVRRPAPRPSARPRRQAAVVAAAARRHVLRQPARNPDFAWAFLSRFLLVMAYAFLVTYQAYYLLDQVGSRGGRRSAPDLPRHARPVRRPGRRRTAHRPAVRPARAPQGLRHGRRGRLRGRAVVIAAADSVNGYLVGMAIGGFGFGMYMAVDLALVVDVLPDTGSRRQGPRRPQHRRGAAVRPRARPRAGTARPRSRQLRRALRGSRRMRPGRSGCACCPSDGRRSLPRAWGSPPVAVWLVPSRSGVGATTLGVEVVAMAAVTWWSSTTRAPSCAPWPRWSRRPPASASSVEASSGEESLDWAASCSPTSC